MMKMIKMTNTNMKKKKYIVNIKNIEYIYSKNKINV